MAKQRMTATQRLLLEEQEDRERARLRAETRRQAAIELGEIVMDAGGYVLSADTLSGVIRKAVAERESATERPLTGDKLQRAKPVRQASPETGTGGDSDGERVHEHSTHAA